MRRRIPFLAALLGLLLLFSLLPASALAEDLDIVIVEDCEDELVISAEELDGELIDLPGEGTDWRVPEEELRPFYGAYGWLQLALDRPLLEQVGHQRGRQACACYSLAYCRTLLDGEARPYSDFNLGTNEDNAWCSWELGDYESLNFTEACEVYERMVEELNAGKPVVILVNGSRTQQHYVAIVGYERVTPGEPLTASNFLMLDTCAADFEPHNLGAAELDIKKLSHGVYQLVVDRTEEALPFEAHRSSYLSFCSVFPGCRSVQIGEGALLQSLPCGAAVDADSAATEVLARGERFRTCALVQNTRGEYWYRGVTADGREGYVNAADCTVGRPLFTGLALSDEILPLCLERGESWAVGGKLSAGGNAFSSIRIEIFAGAEPQGEPILSAELPGERCFCLLEESALAEALPFAALREGTYCLQLSCTLALARSTDGLSLQREEHRLPLLEHCFTIVPGADDIDLF